MGNIKLENGNVEFPERERAFVVNADGRAPFKTAVIGITFPDSNYRIERKAMKELTVFEYVTEGEGEIFIDGLWHKVFAGDTYILSPGEPHKYRASADKPFKKYWINYISDYMSDYLSACGIKTGIFRVNSLPHFEKLREITKMSEIGDDELYSIAEHIHGIIALALKENSNEDTAEKIKSIIDLSLYGKLSLDAVAEKMHISKSGVIRIFKKKFSLTPYEYLLNQKIDVAKMLLKTTGLSVKQIADKLDILDEHYFSTLFYKRVGTRPLKYRHGEF